MSIPNHTPAPETRHKAPRIGFGSPGPGNCSRCGGNPCACDPYDAPILPKGPPDQWPFEDLIGPKFTGPCTWVHVEDGEDGKPNLPAGVDGLKWPMTFDADIWARALVWYMRRLSGPHDDAGWLAGWFANAMMVGYDRGRADAVSEHGSKGGAA